MCRSLIGFTRDESGNELRTARSIDEFNTAAKKYFGDRADQFFKLYPVRSDADVPTVGAHRCSRRRHGNVDAKLGVGASLPKARRPAYVYMYSHPHSYEPGVAIADLNPATAGAYHTSEVPFFLLTQDVYNRIRRTRAWTEYDRALRE